MTQQTKAYLKNNWLTLANFLILLGLAYQVGVAQTTGEKNIETNATAILKNHLAIEEHKKVQETHELNTADHKPMDGLMNTFVPRKEIEARLTNIEDFQEKIYNLVRENAKNK